MREILRFLDVDDSVPVETVETKSLDAVRSQLLRRLADTARRARQNPSEAGMLGRAINALTPSTVRSEAVRRRWRRLVYKPPVPPEQEFMLELRRRFKHEVVALSDYLDRDLVHEWGYDAIG